MGRYSGKTCRLLCMLVITVIFFVAELVSGYLGNSIALISDSFNMLSDLISLCVGLGTGSLARRARRGPRTTYGYARAEAVGALSNAVFLTALCFTIFVEAALRLGRPERIDDPALVLIVGALGLAVNVVGLLVFQDCGSWSSCCRRRRRPPPPPGPPGALGDPQGAARAAPSPDSAVTLRVGKTAEKGATVFANVAGAFRVQPAPCPPHRPRREVLSSTPHALFRSPPPPVSLCGPRSRPLMLSHHFPHGFLSTPTTSVFLLDPWARFACIPSALFFLYSIDCLGN